MAKNTEMTSEDQLELGLELDSSSEFASGSLFNPTTSEPASQVDGTSKSVEPADSGISESDETPPPEMTFLGAEGPAVAETSASPAPMTASTATQTSLAPADPRDWPLGVANDDNRDLEMRVNDDNGVDKARLTALIAQAKSSGRVLVINDKVQRSLGGTDRCKYLQQSLLCKIAEHADSLHLASFRDSKEMCSIVSLAQTLYASSSKYHEVSTFLTESNMSTAKSRQERFRAGKQPAIVIEDNSEPPPAKLPKITRTFLNRAAPEVNLASSAAAEEARSSASLPTTSGAAWPVTQQNNAGWNTQPPQSMVNTPPSAGWNAPPSPPGNYVNLADDGCRLTVLEAQFRDFRQAMNSGRGIGRGGFGQGDGRGGFARGSGRGGFAQGEGRGGFARGGARGGFARGGNRGGFTRR